MTFEEYLTSKNIDSQAFASGEPQVWQRWKDLFDQVHPDSFTVQKLNLINPIRRKYLLHDKRSVATTVSPQSETP